MAGEAAKYCSEPQSVGDFKARCFALIGKDAISHEKIKSHTDSRSPENVAEAFGLGDDIETAKELIDVCSPDNLQCPMEEKYLVDSFDAAKELPDEIDLKLLKHLKYGYRRPEDINHLPVNQDHLKNNYTDDPSQKLADDEVLLSVALYLPPRVVSSKRRKSQEFLVVAKQSLTELRDKLMCVADHALTGECSDTPDLNKYQKPKDTYRSGFFFIEGVFYNDMRDPYNRDYSKVIINWAKSGERWKSAGLGIFKSKRMEETRFEELKIRLGYPYLYCHQGNCEHILIFTDMRLIQSDDPKKLSMYPYLVFRDKPKRKKCSICDLLTARWVTYGDMLAFEEPAFFCQQCLEYLHYDENGKKLYNFEAYPYDGTQS